MFEPWVKDLTPRSEDEGRGEGYKPIWDVTDDANHHSASFSLGGSNRSGLTLEATPLTLNELFLPDSLIDKIVSCTNR